LIEGDVSDSIVRNFVLNVRLLDGLDLMAVSRIGLFCAEVPFGCALFDVLIASFKINTTTVFLIYPEDIQFSVEGKCHSFRGIPKR
jgi:hypothetical protein